MAYCVYFYGLDARQYVELVTAEGLVERVRRNAMQLPALTEEDLSTIEKLVSDGIGEGWPQSSANDAFVAYHWLMETIAEPIIVESLFGFRSWSYWSGAGLWPSFLRERPPFPAPCGLGDVPNVGFLSVDNMIGILAGDESEDMVVAPASRVVRSEVLEILESLVEDRIDLIAVAVS